MNFFKVSFWAGLSTLCTILTGIVSTKFVASQIGPSGVAILGQFYNVTNILSLIGGLGIGYGIVKYISRPIDTDKRKEFLAQVFKFIVPVSIALGIAIMLAAGFLASHFLQNSQYGYSFILFGGTFSLLIFNYLSTNILIGVLQSSRVAVISVINNIISVSITIILFRFFGIKGVFTVISIAAVLSFCMNVYALKTVGILPGFASIRLSPVEKKTLQFLSSFTIMTLVNTLLMPILQLFIRSTLIKNIDTNTAGYWQTVVRFSDYNIMFFTTFLSYYYVPKVSALETPAQIKKEVRQTALLLLPIVFISCLAIWLLRIFLIKAFLSKQFIPAASYMGYQVIGDFFKILAMLMGLLFWVRKKIIPFIASEVVFAVIYGFLFFLLFPKFQTYATVYAYGLNSIIYFVFCLAYFNKYVF